MEKSFKIVLLACSIFLLSACGPEVPPMQLDHLSKINKQYRYLGSFEVQTVADMRPQAQKNSSRFSTTTVPLTEGTVYSGVTSPSAPDYLRSVIISEGTKSGIFRIHSQPKYTMKLYLISMKVSYKSDKLNLPVAVNGTQTPFSVGGYPSYVTEVIYTADIYHHGRLVFTQNIGERLSQSDSNPLDAKNVSTVSHHASIVLDQTTTQSVQKLFKAMEDKLG